MELRYTCSTGLELWLCENLQGSGRWLCQMKTKADMERGRVQKNPKIHFCTHSVWMTLILLWLDTFLVSTGRKLLVIVIWYLLTVIIYTVCKMKCNFLCLFPSYRWSWRHYVFGLSICLCVCAYFILYFMLACLVGGIVWLAFHRLVVYLCNNCNKPWSVFIISLVHMYKWSCN